MWKKHFRILELLILEWRSRLTSQLTRVGLGIFWLVVLAQELLLRSSLPHCMYWEKEKCVYVKDDISYSNYSERISNFFNRDVARTRLQVQRHNSYTGAIRMHFIISQHQIIFVTSLFSFPFLSHFILSPSSITYTLTNPDCLSTVLKEEGIRGWYRGFGSNLLVWYLLCCWCELCWCWWWMVRWWEGVDELMGW
jgi:hypothetical protein